MKGKIFKIHVVPTDFFYFYSTEFLKTTTVKTELHDWALMVALNNIICDPKKKHLENLKGVNFIASPGKFIKFSKVSNLLNPYPGINKKGVNLPSLMRIEKIEPGSIAEFFVYSKDGSIPPKFIAYGKKRTKCAMNIIDEWDAIYKDQYKGTPIHKVNPLDYAFIKPESYKKTPMKPSPIYQVFDTEFKNVVMAKGVILPQNL